MVILCDTSSILMLLRIAPDMFTDERYKCKTIRDVHDEIVQTTKFKTRYPWTREIKSKIRVLSLTDEQKQDETAFFETISTLNKYGTVNRKTERIFDLSHEDMRVISHALSLNYQITSGDRGLVEFAVQEFGDDFQGNISPLEIIIQWLESGLITWDTEKQGYLSAWAADNEHPQPSKAKKRFKELTNCTYTGS
jgi:hypothetical protein